MPDFKRFVDAKVRLARRGAPRAASAPEPDLPPGQHRVERLPVLDLGIRPRIPLQDWRLEVTGLVARPLELDWDDLQACPRQELRADIHCVTRWSCLGLAWEGVHPRELLARAAPGPGATHVTLHGYDGYTTNLPLEALLADGVLLADTLEGRPLPRDHGGPLRLVLPERYFWKSAKWLRAIEIHAGDRPGFWETRGYHNDADPWEEERFGR